MRITESKVRQIIKVEAYPTSARLPRSMRH